MTIDKVAQVIFCVFLCEAYLLQDRTHEIRIQHRKKYEEPLKNILLQFCYKRHHSRILIDWIYTTFSHFPCRCSPSVSHLAIFVQVYLIFHHYNKNLRFRFCSIMLLVSKSLWLIKIKLSPEY